MNFKHVYEFNPLKETMHIIFTPMFTFLIILLVVSLAYIAYTVVFAKPVDKDDDDF